MKFLERSRRCGEYLEKIREGKKETYSKEERNARSSARFN